MTGVFLYPQVGFRDFEVQAKESPSGDFSQVLDKAIGGIEFSDLTAIKNQLLLQIRSLNLYFALCNACFA